MFDSPGTDESLTVHYVEINEAGLRTNVNKVKSEFDLHACLLVSASLQRFNVASTLTAR
jgi:hypothetical protein